MLYMEENIAQPDFSISAMAEYLKTSPSSLSVRYKKATGERLIDHISEKRIAMAEALLRDTKLTIEEIAARTGYGSTSTMYRAFRKYRGYSPNSVRQ